MQKFSIKNNRHLAINIDEIIALDFNESMKEIKLHLRGGGLIAVEGKKAAKIWHQLTDELPELLEAEIAEANAVGECS